MDKKTQSAVSTRERKDKTGIAATDVVPQARDYVCRGYPCLSVVLAPLGFNPRLSPVAPSGKRPSRTTFRPPKRHPEWPDLASKTEQRSRWPND